MEWYSLAQFIMWRNLLGPAVFGAFCIARKSSASQATWPKSVKQHGVLSFLTPKGLRAMEICDWTSHTCQNVWLNWLNSSLNARLLGEVRKISIFFCLSSICWSCLLRLTSSASGLSYYYKLHSKTRQGAPLTLTLEPNMCPNLGRKIGSGAKLHDKNSMEKRGCFEMKTRQTNTVQRGTANPTNKSHPAFQPRKGWRKTKGCKLCDEASKTMREKNQSSQTRRTQPPIPRQMYLLHNLLSAESSEGTDKLQVMSLPLWSCEGTLWIRMNWDCLPIGCSCWDLFPTPT